MSNQLSIEVAYATPERQLIVELIIESGTTPKQAIIDSSIGQQFPEIDVESCSFGVFGKVIKNDYQLEPGDRIEIYRPLIADPKEVRRQRAAKGLKMKKGGGEAAS